MKTKLTLSNKFFTAAWIIFHATLILLFSVSLFFTDGLQLDADLFNMLPSNNLNKAAKIADKNITSTSGKSLFILSTHEDFSKAKEGAEIVYNKLKDSSKFESVSLYSGTADDMSSYQEFLEEWRYNLLSPEVREKISTQEGAEDFSMEALSSIYGALSFGTPADPENDPFFLDNTNLMTYLKYAQNAGPAMQPKDGVLANRWPLDENGEATEETKWNVMIRLQLSDEGAALASKKNAVPLIYDVCLPLEKDGLKFIFSGTTFHSYRSSSDATNEVSVISAVSVIMIVIMMLVVFRSPLPILASVFSISVSMFTAFCTTHFVFGGVHMMSLVFGTSLIGSSIDYTLHFFINWKGRRKMNSGRKIRAHLFNGLFLSLLSTEICYALLMGAPFLMLKQVAVFSFTGILSSFLTVTGLFTLLKIPPREKRTISILNRINFTIPNKKVTAKLITIVLLAFSAATLFICRDRISIKNDFTALYQPKGRLKYDAAKAFQILNYNPTSWFIVSGDSEEEVLQREEKIMKSLEGKSFICTACFVPSIKSQEESYQASKNLINLKDYRSDYLEFDDQMEESFTKDFEKRQGKYLTPKEKFPSAIQSVLDIIWIGRHQGKYYSLVLPAIVQPEEEAEYNAIADEDSNIYFENRVKDISYGLDRLSLMITEMFLIAFVVIFIVLKVFYSWKDTLKIASVPAISVLMITSVFTIAGLKIEFFCITGMILVFGLGLDYIIYKMENKESKAETFAIALSFLTTAFSFGAIMFSSFMPVHVLGVSIFVGLVTSFLLTII
ncbi:MMPL family transporter [Treponema sp.]|uniref:MMPL family transporter n=1 Tax=Treponema sp. TaxID=166 RepID=UPI0025E3CEAA|nr:MMPL family transporter [Treponema sp.]MCR5218061.1 MMPL family transporter [Treponema sp.]